MLSRACSIACEFLQEIWFGKPIQIQIACNDMGYQMALDFAMRIRGDSDITGIPVSVRAAGHFEISEDDNVEITAGSLHILTSSVFHEWRINLPPFPKLGGWRG